MVRTPFCFANYDYGSPTPGIRGVLNNPITGLQSNKLLRSNAAAGGLMLSIAAC